MSKNLERLHAGSRGGSFCIVLAVDSSTTTTDVPRLKVGGIPMFVTLKLEGRVAMHDVMPGWDR